MSPTLCVLPGCAIRGRHVDDCPQDGSCRGCLPARAADGVLLCALDVRRIGQNAARLARLYPALEKRLIYRGQPGEYTTGSSTGAPVPDDRVMELRDEIRAALVETALIVMRRRGIHGPVRRVIRRLPEGVEGPAQLATVATGNREALAKLIADHTEWIAAQPDAAAIAGRLQELGRPGGEAWRAAFSIGPQVLYVGDCPLDTSKDDAEEPKVCGGRLIQIPDEPLITCNGCGHADTIEQWQRWLYPDEESPEVDAYAGARHLSLHWFRPVAPGTIRAWASTREAKVSPIMVPDPSGKVDADGEPVLVRKTDEKHRTLYRLADLVEAATKAWGPAPNVRRAA